MHKMEEYNDILKNYVEANLAKKIKTLEAETAPVLDGEKVHFIRCDGRHFKSFCKGFAKPFDDIFRKAMRRTMVSLCEEISGSFLGYTQSDEITIAFKKPSEESELYFNGRRTKIVTSVAGYCTLMFNRFFEDEIEKAKVWRITELLAENDGKFLNDIQKIVQDEFEKYDRKKFSATFDARVFSMDFEEYSDAIIWRIMDCHKNAIQMIARCHFSVKELHQKKTFEMKQMLEDKGIILNEEDIRNLYGTVAYKKKIVLNKGTETECIRNKFMTNEPYEKMLQDIKEYL